jgi:hypothetical protein
VQAIATDQPTVRVAVLAPWIAIYPILAGLFGARRDALFELSAI